MKMSLVDSHKVMKLNRMCMIVVASCVASFTGCATVKVTSHEYCLTYHPIVATKAEFLALPDDIARQLLGNENTYAQLCK